MAANSKNRNSMDFKRSIPSRIMKMLWKDSPNMRKNPNLPNNEDLIQMNFCNRITIASMLQNLQENTVSSPLSINILLNMLVNGLEPGSTGQIKLMHALDLKSVAESNSISSKLMNLMNSTSSTNRGPRLSMTNGVWTDFKCPIKKSFGEIAAQTYRADTRSFDISNKPDEMIKYVNSWAEEKTNGLIKDLISPNSLSEDTALLLANALYFKGTWKVPFKTFMTGEGEFYGRSGISKVPFMNRRLTYCFCRALDGFRLLKLPYKSGDDESKQLSLNVFLPDKTDGLKGLLKRFDADPSLIHTSCNEIESTTKKFCNISIPKFKISCGFEPSAVMKSMGLCLKELGALTNMVESAVIEARATVMVQKSCIEVNEDGTEAASAAYAKVAYMCAESPVDFVADHPFFFVIKDDITGATLFNGTVCAP